MALFSIVVAASPDSMATRMTAETVLRQSGVECLLAADGPSAATATAIAEALGLGPVVLHETRLGAISAAQKAATGRFLGLLPAGARLADGALAAATVALNTAEAEGQDIALIAGAWQIGAWQIGAVPNAPTQPEIESLISPLPFWPAAVLARPALWQATSGHDPLDQPAMGRCLLRALLDSEAQACLCPEWVTALPEQAPEQTDEDLPAGIMVALRDLALSRAEAETLATATDVEALAALTRRARSARLNVALARKLQAAGMDPIAQERILGPIDWTAPTRFICSPSAHGRAPLFTVLVATFNAAADLPDTLRAIAAQNREDVECIVIDGGSRDETLDVVRQWPGVVTQCFSQRDRGLYDALNKGIALARGTLIGIVGAGDCYLPGALDAVAQAHYAHLTDVYGGQTLEISPQGTVRKRKDEPWGLNAFVSGGPVGHNGMFASRAAYDAVGFFGKTYPMAEDTRWMHRAIRQGCSFTYVAQPVVLFPLTGMSNSNPDLVWQEAHGLIRQNFPLLDLNREDALKLLFGARGWCPPEEVRDTVARLNHMPLSISTALALKAEQVDTARMLEIFDGVLWAEAAPLFERNGLRFAPEIGLESPSAAPLLSIVLPCYNVGDYLGKAINSILMQDMEDLEVIVVIDGATDHSHAVARAFAAVDARVRIHEQANRGLGGARTAALPLCRGRYVWFVDSDDHLRAGSLGRIAAVLRDDAPDVYRVNFAYIDEEGRIENASITEPEIAGMVWRPVEREVDFGRLASGNAQTWRFIMRRDLLARHDLNWPDHLYYEDHHFALKLLSRAELVFADTAVSYYYLRRAGSISTLKTRKAMDFLKIRRLCLDLLKSENLLERVPGIAAFYLMPAEFVRHHLADEFHGEFVAAALGDMDARERAMFLRAAGSAEFRLVQEHAPGWVEGLAADTTTAPWLPLLHGALRQNLPAAAKRGEGLHPASQTLRPDQILGLTPAESWAGGPGGFLTRQGEDVVLRLSLRGYSRPTLFLRYRNRVPGQMLVIEGPGVILSCPPTGQDPAQEQSVMVPLPPASKDTDGDLVLRISPSLAGAAEPGAEAILITSMDLVNGAVGAHLLPPGPIKQVPAIQAGPGARVAGLNVDVRVKRENRTYAVIGADAAVAGTFVFERGTGMITVGAGSSIGGGSLLICTQPEGIRIGRNVMLSWNVTINDSNSHPLDRAMRENDATDWTTGVQAGAIGAFKTWHGVTSAPVTIEDGAWIGYGSAIMKGVTIGAGAIVASKSVVTRDVPPYAVVGGNPARILSQNEAAQVEQARRNAPRYPDLPLPEVSFGPKAG